QVAEALGDVGLAIRFGGTTRLADRPRAFEELVTAAAERHELDPNLLLAVMRVESVYDPEIVSYAGAIGLLQIMPRTGRLIAHRLGLSDFRTDDLLDPATNIELAAWYLRSLLDRFEGRLPLAIAAYNGGPHNVRRWMEEHGPELPLDAFLERIPFDQTFRYVRRVLSHYAAYRAQQGLELPTLDTTLPPRATDSVAF
ncbi:MAG: lytic transglycosylase domain-containing protein, partial [Sandaracinaceae bacterium]|nr:lytic transglycosylase domain-containing protein [Sandaracinaceae bacterium]